MLPSSSPLSKGSIVDQSGLRPDVKFQTSGSNLILRKKFNMKIQGPYLRKKKKGLTFLQGTSQPFLDFPGGSVVKNLPANSGDTGSIPGLGRSPRKGNSNSLQYSCLENPMNRGALWSMGSQRVGYDLASKQQLSFLPPDRRFRI